MTKKDRQRLRSLVTQYIEKILEGERYPEKAFLMYDYGIQTKYGLLRIALDRDYEASELFTLFCQFDEPQDIYKNPHLFKHSNKYNLHVVLSGRTVEDCFALVKNHLNL